MEGLTLSPLLGDGMVIQQGVPFPVCGRSIPGTEVSAAFLGKTCRMRSNEEDGAWQITLDPVPAGGPFTLEIESGEVRVVIRDIYSGDVWLCAGQSNMEMRMERLRDDFPEEWMPVDFPPIRQFTVPQEWDFSGPREEFTGGSWLAASRESLHEFSGTAWFFAKNLFEKYRAPIGLVNAAWGGTPVEAWMSREALASFPDKIARCDTYAEIAGKSEAEIQDWEKLLNREDRGLAEEWNKPETDISAWNELCLPGDFAEAGLTGFCGVIWLCREFEINADFAASDVRLWLGTITDTDTVYINGVEAGNTGYRYPPRKYTVFSGLLREGKNRIVIRVSCINGEGGVTRNKPFRFFSETGTVELAGIWKYRIGVNAVPRPEAFFFQRQPCGPYNAMIAPFLKYPFRGVIWYQGESNESEPGEYGALFRAVIQDWRKKSADGFFPFLFVQLPVFGSPSENDEAASWAIIREAQKDALSLPCTGMAAALDLGEWNDLHPVNKRDVGFRLFMAAEQVVFKNQNTSPGPLLRSTGRRGEKLILTFDNCGGGLCAKEQAFVSVIADGRQFRLPVEIESPDTLSLDISVIEKPEKILYAWAGNPRDRQLYNSEGLPVIPFRVLC